jgi:hypothetical protein
VATHSGDVQNALRCYRRFHQAPRLGLELGHLLLRAGQ